MHVQTDCKRACVSMCQKEREGEGVGGKKGRSIARIVVLHTHSSSLPACYVGQAPF